MKFGTWLLAMCEPLLGKILMALGFSVVTIVGMEVVVDQLKNEVVSSLSGMPGVWLQFALYLWIGKGIGIIFGAIATKLTLWSIQNATSMLGRSNG